jgi:hypothetical protein
MKIRATIVAPKRFVARTRLVAISDPPTQPVYMFSRIPRKRIHQRGSQSRSPPPLCWPKSLPGPRIRSTPTGFLKSKDITHAILNGRQLRDPTAEKLLEHSRLPLAWHDQRAAQIAERSCEDAA